MVVSIIDSHMNIMALCKLHKEVCPCAHCPSGFVPCSPPQTSPRPAVLPFHRSTALPSLPWHYGFTVSQFYCIMMECAPPQNPPSPWLCCRRRGCRLPIPPLHHDTILPLVYRVTVKLSHRLHKPLQCPWHGSLPALVTFNYPRLSSRSLASPGTFLAPPGSSFTLARFSPPDPPRAAPSLSYAQPYTRVYR